MLKRALFLLTIFLTVQLSAQSEEDFDKFGQMLFRQMTDTSYAGQLTDFIRIREYEEIIDRQEAPIKQKEIMKIKVNESYNGMYLDWQNSMQELASDYLYEINDGSTFEYLETRHEPLDQSEDTYAMKTNFIYRNGRVQNQVSFTYDVAWLDRERGFVLISAVEEDF